MSDDVWPENQGPAIHREAIIAIVLLPEIRSKGITRLSPQDEQGKQYWLSPLFGARGRISCGDEQTFDHLW